MPKRTNNSPETGTAFSFSPTSSGRVEIETIEDVDGIMTTVRSICSVADTIANYGRHGCPAELVRADAAAKAAAHRRSN